MSDDADLAEERIESVIDDGLAQIRHRMSYRELEPCGACHWCNDALLGGRLFCSRECSDDYELYKRTR